MSNVPDKSRYKPNYDLTEEDIFGSKATVARREYFLMDDDGNQVEPGSGRATHFVATEYDEQGNMISESFGVVGRREEPEPEPEPEPQTLFGRLRAHIDRLGEVLRRMR